VNGPEDGYEYLTEDGKLPSDLDWTMDVVIREKERGPETHPGTGTLDWEAALDLASRFIEEEFPDLPPFHDSLNGGLDVGYTFEFMPGPENRVIAMAKLHPAVNNRYVNDVITDEVMAEACMIVTFRNPRTQGAVLEHLKETGRKGLEALPEWGGGWKGGALYIKLRDGPISHSAELSDDVILDIGEDGLVMGMDLQNVSTLGQEHEAMGGPDLRAAV
jgi:hypothetical protein